jgi:sugar/nucleoside kinase (ribokinase family)
VTPDLVLLGNLLVDDVVFPDGRTRMGQPGGAILYASLAAALWGARTGCVSLRGDDYPEHALESLRGRGIATDGIRPLGKNGVRTWLLYEGRVRRVVHRLGCPTHEEVSPGPDDVPESWRAARAFHLAPMPIALQTELARRMGAGGAHLSIDPHEIVTEASLPRWRETLAHADSFFPSEDEMRLDDAQSDPRRALRRLAGGRLRFIAYKRGLKGGLLYDAREDRFHEWAPRTHGIADPTGSGDAFAASFLVAHLRGLPVEDCLRHGVVGASFAIGDWGPDGLLGADPADAAMRLREWFGQEARA